MEKPAAIDPSVSAAPVSRFGAASVLAFGAVGLLLYAAHAVFIPIAMALLFALVLSGPVEAMHRLKVPRWLSALAILVLVLTLMAGAVELVWAPAQQWYKSAPQTVQVVKRKLAPVAKFLAHLEDLASNAGSLGNNRPAAVPTPPVAPPAAAAPEVILFAARDLIIGSVTFAVITLFLLTGGPPMLARMTAAFVDDLNSVHVLDIIEKVRNEVGRFYVATAIINIGLGCATAGVMMLCGMPTPYLWGIVAAALNFIPYAGAATTLTVVTLVALVTFDDVGRILAVAGSYIALSAIEGQIVQPLLVGRRLEVNPLLIFLALWFGGFFWGIAGIILATPALVALKVVTENVASGKSVMEFMGPNDQTPDDERAVEKYLRPVLRPND